MEFIETGSKYVSNGQKKDITVGACVASSVSNSAGAILSGSFTPTFSNLSGISSPVNVSAEYLRVGARVYVSGKLTATTSGTPSEVKLDSSLPVASTFTDADEAVGSALYVEQTKTKQGNGFVYSVAAGGVRMEIDLEAAATASNSCEIAYSYSYQVL